MYQYIWKQVLLLIFGIGCSYTVYPQVWSNDSDTHSEADIFIVKYPPHATMSGNATLPGQRLGLLPGGYEIRRVNPQSLNALIQAGQILEAERNFPFYLNGLPNDPLFDQQWALHNTGQLTGTPGHDIGAAQAWNMVHQSNDIAGIIDTGIDYGHEDLKDNIWQNMAEDADGDGQVLEWNGDRWQLDPGDLNGIDEDGNGYVDDLIGWDFVNDDNDPLDDNGHGTHVAGTIAARGDNGIGIAGVAWKAKLMALKSFDHRGGGSSATILPAMAYARMMGVSLTNNSWGGASYSAFLYNEIALARDADQLCIAAAGNQGGYEPIAAMYPAAFDLENIISVGSIGSDGSLSNFSSYGNTSVDLAAPGYKILSTLPDQQYGEKSGTSMAAAVVSGAVLLLHSYRSSLSLLECKDVLLQGSKLHPSLYGKCLTGGSLDLPRSLVVPNQLGNGGSLQAAFRGQYIGCVNHSLDFTNLSQSPLQDSTTYQWKLGGQILSNSLHLTYAFPNAGAYEIVLVANYENQLDSISQLVYIQAIPIPDLGPDTTICASAWLLSANSNGFNYTWKRLACPGGQNPCPGPNDYSMLDSISFKINGGDIAGLIQKYVLTDAQGTILAISDQALFSPQSSMGTYQVYGLYYDSLSSIANLQTGVLVQNLNLAGISCGGLSSPISFNVIGAQIVGNEPVYIARESGLYVLEVKDFCGNIQRDTLLLNLTDGCVWPGDANADGVVSLTDFLCLGIANQISGLPRIAPTTFWQSEQSADWASGFSQDHPLAPQVNHKHSDANGDGLIDLDTDGQVVLDNLGFLHRLEVPLDSSGANLFLEHVNTTFINSDSAMVQLNVHLEASDGGMVDEIFGMAFNLNFSDPIIEAPSFAIEENAFVSPMASMVAFFDNSQYTSGSSFLSGNRKKAGFATVNRDQDESSVTGPIAAMGVCITVDDLADDPEILGYTSFTISPENLILIDQGGKVLAVNHTSGLQSISIDIHWPSNPSLPLEWKDFQVSQDGQDALLEWQTLYEENTVQFVVERSLDGRLFQSLADQNAHGSHKPYSYRDRDIHFLGKQKIYYRLKYIDVDGHYSYSEKLALNLNPDFIIQLNIYPNPTEDLVWLDWSAPEAPSEIRVLNTLGQELLRVRQGLEAQHKGWKLDLSGWTKGMYLIQVNTEYQSVVRKIILH